MFDSLGGIVGTMMDPLNLRNSGNPVLSFLADPLGIIPGDEDGKDDEEETDPLDDWEAAQQERLARGPLPTSGAMGQHMAAQTSPRHHQRMLANRLRGVV